MMPCLFNRRIRQSEAVKQKPKQEAFLGRSFGHGRYCEGTIITYDYDYDYNELILLLSCLTWYLDAIRCESLRGSPGRETQLPSGSASLQDPLQAAEDGNYVLR